MGNGLRAAGCDGIRRRVGFDPKGGGRGTGQLVRRQAVVVIWNIPRAGRVALRCHARSHHSEALRCDNRRSPEGPAASLDAPDERHAHPTDSSHRSCRHTGPVARARLVRPARRCAATHRPNVPPSARRGWAAPDRPARGAAEGRAHTARAGARQLSEARAGEGRSRRCEVWAERPCRR